jgi:hypothetical protein
MKSKAVYNYIKEKHTQEECSGFIDGYEKCEEDMAERKYTLNDMKKVFEYGKTLEPFDSFEDFIDSLNKQD